MNKEKEIRNIGKLIALHLLPGVVLTVVYLFMLNIGELERYPKVIILGLSGAFSIVTVQLGYLFYVAKKEEKSFNIFKILGLKSKLKIKEYVFYTILLLGVAGAFMTILKPLSNYMLDTVFAWIPIWYNYMEDMSLFSRSFIIITILVNLFFFTLIGPIIEEFYFRGYLLARTKWMGKYGVLLNVVLFSIYHFWSPWLIIARIVAFLPVFYCVYKKDSLKLSILVHCLANFTDVVSLVILL